MGLTNSLYTGLSGLSTHSQMLTISGNNIANANTPGFKGSRLTFESHILQNLRSASAPNGDLGGSNPAQVGLGTRLGAITRNFAGGTIQPTGVNTDVALEGGGFFIINHSGVPSYTRAGNFVLDRDLRLTKDGGLVQGYGVDDQGNVNTATLVDVHIPLGDTLAKATENVAFSGNLNAAGDVATIGSITTSGPLYLDAAATIPATAASALTALFNADGTQLFNLGDVITVSGAAKGGANLPDHTFEVGAANTTESDAFGLLLSDFLNFMDEVLGLNSEADPNAGITVSAAGEIVVNGNTGTVNNITIDTANIIVNKNSTATLPFTWNQTQNADGESARTTFVTYDSLGNQSMVHMTMVLESKTNAGTSWRFYAESADDTDLDRVLGTGTLTFDNNGKVISSSGTSIIIDRDGTGAQTPLPINLLFQDTGGTLTALADTQSQFNAEWQDGAATGTLQDFAVGEDGTITGIYSNNLLRTLGRIAVAKFTNPQGLKEIGANLFQVTANSGEAQIVTAGSGGTGRMVGGALELSNVELSQEFINLITASTGFSASSRVMTTSDRLIQELMQSVR